VPRPALVPNHLNAKRTENIFNKMTKERYVVAVCRQESTYSGCILLRLPTVAVVRALFTTVIRT
jgi:hypothetical protein